MKRVRFIEHRGTSILLEDFREMRYGEEFLDLLEQAKKMIRSQPEATVLTLLDVTGTRYNVEMANQIKHFADGNKPYVRAGVVVGLTGTTELVLKAVSLFTRRNFITFDALKDAKDWLAEEYALETALT